MSATQDRNTYKRHNNLLVLAVAATTRIFAGTMVARNAAGHAVPAADAAGLRVMGRANQQVNNVGAAGEAEIEVERLVFLYDNDETDPVTIADVGEVCYVLDDETVSADDGDHAVIAGVVHAVTTDGVWVDQTNPFIPGPKGDQGEPG